MLNEKQMSEIGKILDKLADDIMNDESCPNYIRIPMAILAEQKKACAAISNLAKIVAVDPNLTENATEHDIKVLKDTLEYMTLVREGIENYTEGVKMDAHSWRLGEL